MKVSVPDVALALEDNRNYAEFLLNRTDGKVLRITRDVLEAVEDDDAESLSESSQEEISLSESFIFNSHTPLVLVPPVSSSRRIKLMVDFTQTMAGAEMRKALGDILQSRNPSMRFHAALTAHPDEQKKWTDYKNRFYQTLAEEWLKTVS